MTISTTARRVVRWAVVPAALGLGLGLTALAAPPADGWPGPCDEPPAATPGEPLPPSGAISPVQATRPSTAAANSEGCRPREDTPPGRPT